MPMSRTQKEQEVDNLKKGFEENDIFVVAHYSGLTVAQMTEYRAKLRAEGASFKVVKNRLAKRAIEGTDYEHMTDLFAGPTGLAASNDPAVAKVTYEFAKKNKQLVILGGALGAVKLDAAAVEQLAKLPSLDELRGKLIGILQAPAQKVAGVLQAPAGGLARVVGAYAAKGE